MVRSGPVPDTKGPVRSGANNQRSGLVRCKKSLFLFGRVLLSVGPVRSSVFSAAGPVLLVWSIVFFLWPDPVCCFLPSNNKFGPENIKTGIRTGRNRAPDRITDQGIWPWSCPVQRKNDLARSDPMLLPAGPVWSGCNVYPSQRSGPVWSLFLVVLVRFGSVR